MNEDGLNTCGACEGVRSLTPADVTNPPGLPALRWRVGTHGRFLATMLARLSGLAIDKTGRDAANNPVTHREYPLAALQTRDPSDPTIALLDAWAAALDVLSFYQERLANEHYLGTATETRSILELARAIGYELAPGVAASTRVAFTLETAPGAPPAAVIPAGTRLQSIPGQDEKPQTYETSTELHARAAWNSMAVRTRGSKVPYHGQSVIYLAGVSTGLAQGDRLLIVGDERANNAGNENWDFRRVRSVTPVNDPTDPARSHTEVRLERALGSFVPFSHPARQNPRVFVMRQRAALFGHNAPEWRLLPAETQRAFGTAGTDPEGRPEWPNFNIGYASAPPVPPTSFRTLYLDTTYQAAVPNAWLLLSAEQEDGGTYEELYRIVEATESGQRQFGISGKSTKVRLSGENLVEKFWTRLRQTSVFISTEELTLVEEPITTAIPAQSDRLELENTLFGDDLPPAGREVMLEGFDPATGEPRSEALVLDGPAVNEMIDGRQVTVLRFTSLLRHSYARATLRVRGNVVQATHGETRKETLGSGDGSAEFQSFVLKGNPITHVSSALAPNGRLSSLEIRVGGVRWEEVPSFHGRGPDERIYITRRSDSGAVTVTFGDGRTGARLPTGVENVTATYRVGIGLEGTVRAGQLSQLLSRPFGVKEAINLQDASGAEDPEERDAARVNAPLTVLTLDRVVSARDYEDFARAYAGIGKAAAILLPAGEEPLVHITVALADESSPPPDSITLANLVDAIDRARHPLFPVLVQGYQARSFTVVANVAIDPDHEEAAVLDAARSALLEAFSFRRRQFAQEVTEAEVVATLQGVAGVVYVDLDTLADGSGNPAVNGWLPARPARREADTVLPAELLTLSSENITLVPIAP